jgi:hypothetical protein
MALKTYFIEDIEGSLDSVRIVAEGTAQMIQITGGDPLLMTVFLYATHKALQAVAADFGSSMFSETLLERELFAQIGERNV